MHYSNCCFRTWCHKTPLQSSSICIMYKIHWCFDCSPQRLFLEWTHLYRPHFENKFFRNNLCVCACTQYLNAYRIFIWILSVGWLVKSPAISAKSLTMRQWRRLSCFAKYGRKLKSLIGIVWKLSFLSVLEHWIKV